ncbi:leucine-rich repeat-containing G-protein coupled receptor 4-like [Aedes albopictus]|uniref:Membrane glycoprotein lig-1 n=1 Tax=Aedes albopictus TaxID=7160 RepID=A0ABM1Z5A4_AEDAL
MQSFNVWLCFLAIFNCRAQDAFPSASNHQYHICSISTHYYDCQIQGVRIKKGELHEFKHEPQKQRITFRDSVLRYLPKSFIDAFPKMELLKLNQLQITTIEDNAFENAVQLKELFLANNHMQTFPVNVLYGARNLKKLVLTANLITNMAYNFESNILLNHLFVDNNKINQLPSFKYIPKLETFNGSNNALDHIEWNQFIRQTQLEHIDLSYNQLTNLDLQLSSKVLHTVDIRNNKLAKLRITLQMSHLNIENNVLSEFVIDQVCLLETLKMSNNKLASQPNFTNCQSLEILDVSSNALENFRYTEKLENLRKLNLAHNNLFEFSITPKPKKQLKLTSLDLSHNKLSYLISLPSFTSLKELRLNNNQLLGIHKNPLPMAVQLYVSNNQWNCADVESFANLVKDQVQNCTAEFYLTHGICCKRYRKTFNDVLNEMVRLTNFHEQSDYDKLKNKCPQRQYNTQNTDIERIRQLASEADRSRSQIYEEIASAKESVTTKQSELNTIKKKYHKSDNFKSNMAILIENKRDTYHVTKESLITDKEMLNRVINFVRQRDTFSAELLNRRMKETQNTHTSFGQKTDEKEQIKSNIEELKKNLSSMKKEIEKQRKFLQEQVKGNASSMYGETGR